MQERGLAQTQTPLLGGLAILVGVLVAGALFLPASSEMRGILGAAALITAVGIVDDVRELSPGLKLLGQAAAGLICVLSGVRVDDFTFPFLGRVDLGELGGPLTLLGLVAVMNVVNFSDGVDGLAAGVCAISAIGFAIIAFDLREDAAGVLAACIAGSALGFLVHNFHPASVFMGDSGSNLLGLLLGAVIVEGSLKTNALIALVVPLVILAVPFLDTGFVVAKRIKYRRPVYQGDSNHFHHRFHRMGFSQRKTVLYLYAWTTMMTGIAVALRFVPYSESNGQLNVGWAAVMGGLLAARGWRPACTSSTCSRSSSCGGCAPGSCGARTPTPPSTRSTRSSRRISRPASSRRCAEIRVGLTALARAEALLYRHRPTRRPTPGGEQET